MKKILIVLSAFLFAISAKSQGLSENQTKNNQHDKNEQGYLIKQIFPLDVYNVYEFTDSAKVKRVYPDNSIAEYTRVYTYYLTEIRKKDYDDGFQKISVVIDSMKYYFKEKDAVVEYNSQDTKSKRSTFDDLIMKTVPMGRDFDMTISPYSDVVKVEGDHLDQLMKMLHPKGPKVDTMIVIGWERGISLPSLAYFADLDKSILPNEMMYKDSVYKEPFSIQVEGVNYVDTALVKLEDELNSSYVIKGKFNKLTSKPEIVKLYNVKFPTQPLSSKGSGFYEIQIDMHGTIQNVRSEINSETKFKYNESTINQTVNSKLNWKLKGQYKW